MECWRELRYEEINRFNLELMLTIIKRDKMEEN